MTIENSNKPLAIHWSGQEIAAYYRDGSIVIDTNLESERAHREPMVADVFVRMDKKNGQQPLCIFEDQNEDIPSFRNTISKYWGSLRPEAATISEMNDMKWRLSHATSTAESFLRDLSKALEAGKVTRVGRQSFYTDDYGVRRRFAVIRDSKDSRKIEGVAIEIENTLVTITDPEVIRPFLEKHQKPLKNF